MNNKKRNNCSMAVFLDYADGQSIKENIQYPQFFIEELKIYDIRKYHENLCRNGYLLSEGNVTYLTDKGKHFISEHRSLIDFFWETSTTVTLKEYIEYIESNRLGYAIDGEKFTEAMICILEDKLEELMETSEDCYVTLFNSLLDLARLYRRHGDEYVAWRYYIIALYYQTSGVEYYNDIISFINKERSLRSVEESFSSLYINYEIIDGLSKMKNLFDEVAVESVFDEMQTRINLYSKSEFVKLAKSISDGEFAIMEFLSSNSTKYKAILEKAKQY